MAGADNTFVRGSVTVADRKAAQGGAPVFFYHLDWETPVMEGKRYVPHALDIGMVFDNVAKSESMSGTGEDAQKIDPAGTGAQVWRCAVLVGLKWTCVIPANDGEHTHLSAGRRQMVVARYSSI